MGASDAPVIVCSPLYLKCLLLIVWITCYETQIENNIKLNELSFIGSRPEHTKTNLMRNTANVRMEMVMSAVSADGKSIPWPPPSIIPRFSACRFVRFFFSAWDGQSIFSLSSNRAMNSKFFEIRQG